MGEVEKVQDSFTDEQCDRAALLSVNGYNEEAIGLACRISTSEVRILLNDPRVRAKAGDFAEDEFGKEIGLNSDWDAVEQEALQQLKAEIECAGVNGLTVTEKLAIANAANRATRRNKVGGNGKHGVIDPASGGGDVITLNMPSVVIERLQVLSGVKGQEVIDGEFQEIEEIENSIDQDVTTKDIEKFLGVNVQDPDAAKASLDNTSGKLDVLLSGIAKSGVGVSDEFG